MAAKKDYSEIAKTCDALIKAGKIAAVSNIISKLSLSRFPRAWRQPFAKICRRAGLIDKGLALLFPVVRGARPATEPASPGEICEYSVLLSRNGSVDEALELLTGTRAGEAQEANLYRAFCHISKWEYGNAKEYLIAFLASNPDSYSRLIATVNLGSAQIAIGHTNDAHESLNLAMEQAAQHGSHRLVGNCLELRAQVHILQGEFSKAREDLNGALAIFGEQESYDQLLVKKWQAVIRATEEKSIQPLVEFRAEAMRRHHWESVREADLYLLKVQFDSDVFNRLLFGTPLTAYRQRIQEQLAYQPENHYVFGRQGLFCLDLLSGRLGGEPALKPGEKTHQVLAALLRDLYAPQNIGKLFSQLYPQEYFDVNSSALRVRQHLSRARAWLAAHHIPAKITHSSGHYRLEVTGAFGVILPFDNVSKETGMARMLTIRNTFALGQAFRVEEACARLKLSRSSFHRFSEWAIGQNLLHKSGRGRATLYWVADAA